MLSTAEIIILDILLSWKRLTENEEDETKIAFADIDWIRSKQRKNKDYIKEVHKTYLNIFEQLSKLYFVHTYSIDIDALYKNVFPLFSYKIDYVGTEAIGITYKLGELEKMLDSYNQVTEINCNIFKYRFTEDMKYKLTRYLVTAIFMNQVKSKSFVRTHKSILKGMTYCGTNNYISYYDLYMNNEHIHKYLSRYISRLKEVLEMLKISGYIKDYTIEKITNKQELITGCGKVEIITNLSKKKHKRCYTSVK